MDPFKVLGVDRSATKDEIKSAYRKAVLEFHPDRNSSPGAKNKFIEIQSAYDKISQGDYTDSNFYYKNPDDIMKLFEEAIKQFGKAFNIDIKQEDLINLYKNKAAENQVKREQRYSEKAKAEKMVDNFRTIKYKGKFIKVGKS